MNEEECPVCKSVAEICPSSRDGTTYNCPRCGRYTMVRTLIDAIDDYSNKMPALSGYLREKTLFEEETPMLYSSHLGGDEALDLPRYSPLEKQKKLFRAIERFTTYPGEVVELHPRNDVSLAWAQDAREFEYYLKSLRDRGFVDTPDRQTYNFVVITTAGWEYLEKNKTDFASKTQVFVAMSFHEDLLPVYRDAIAPAISSTGYRPYRVDIKPHLDRIDAKIIREIKDSRFIVADVTRQKQGVYYEAGFAYGLGIPVIWCVRKDDFDNIHFDTRQYNHIIWETADELKEKLEDTVLATIRRGPIKDHS